MRYAFIITVFALLQLFSVGAGFSLQWWLQPWLTSNLQIIMWVVILGTTNGLLLAAVSKHFTNSYRWVSGWMLVMHYMILTALACVLIYSAYWLLVALTGNALLEPQTITLGLRAFAVVLFIGLFFYTLHAAYIPTFRTLAIHIDKPLSESLRIAMVSDLHLGKLFGNKAIARLQRIIDKHRADILLMPGDIMDDNTHAFTDTNMAKGLSELCASLPYGVYATLGNHDLYGHELPISNALRDAGVTLLNDEVHRLEYKDKPIWLIGRFDNHKRARVATTELLAQVDTGQPVILLDHRPSDITAHSEMDIDLQVSGHTHNGQIFPANFIVNAINRIGYGYEAIGKGHFIVSSGYGFWGIPFRLGSRAEVWMITVSGNAT